MIVFALLTTAESFAPRPYYVSIYLAKVCIVTLTLLFCKDSWADFFPKIRVIPLAVLIGVGVCVVWVVLDKWVSYPHLGTRSAINPFNDIASPAVRAVFFLARFYGLVLMVPLMEEIFWRSFLLRYLSDPDFKRLPHGTFSWSAFIWVAAAFSVSHPEWLAALLTAVAYALLLKSSKSIFACFLAHLTSNLCLGIYILQSGEWGYW
jgi:CAAX prenyl protease-like protein